MSTFGPEYCQHYYVGRGDGWPACVKCGAAPPDDWPPMRAALTREKPCTCSTPDLGPSPVCPMHGHRDGMRQTA